MRTPTILALALALIPGLAGCVALDGAPDVADPLANVSQVLYDQTLAEPLPITASDGAVLDAWIFRPDTAATGEKVPVIINFSPYWSNLAPSTASGGDAFSQYLIDHFVPRGYAVALVSARGTGLSDGCFTIGGAQEIDDEDVTATFLATQPWANGNVSAVAKSYDGTMAQGLLTRNNPHVRTIVPVSPISEFYKYNYVNGVPYEVGGLIFNTYYVQETSLQQSEDPQSPTWQKTPTRFCAEAVDVQASQYQSAFTGDYTPYWQARNYTALLPEEIGASVFYIHGLQDWNVKPDHMVPWIDELRARNVTVKMWLGQWAHDYPHRDDMNATLLRWFDQELKGIDTGILSEPLVQVQDDEGVWRDESEWPVARAKPLALHPSEDGSLGVAEGSGGGSYLDGSGPGVPIDTMVGGKGALVFATQPLAKDLRLVGAPVLHALVSSTTPRGTLSATLYRDGDVVNQGFLDLAHRNGLERSEPMRPGDLVPVTVPFYPQDTVLPAGSVLRLVLSHAAPGGAPVQVTPASSGGLVSLDYSGTTLTLPVIDGADVRPEARQPVDLGCWTC